MLLQKISKAIKVFTESLCGVPDHPLVHLEHLLVVFVLQLPFNVMIPQLVTPPLSTTLRHSLLVLTADKCSIILLNCSAVVHVVDPQVSRQRNRSSTLVK